MFSIGGFIIGLSIGIVAGFLASRGLITWLDRVSIPMMRDASEEITRLQARVDELEEELADVDYATEWTEEVTAE